MPDKCLIDPERDCLGIQKANQVEVALNELRRQNAGTHERFGERIGRLESHNEVQDVRFENSLEKLSAIASDVRELKEETKLVNRQLPALSNRVDTLQESYRATDSDVDELKEKPAKRWDNMTSQIIGFVIAAIVGFVLAKLGLSA